MELAFNLQSKNPAVVTPSTEENGSTSKEQDGTSTTEEPEGMSIENAAMNISELKKFSEFYKMIKGNTEQGYN